MKKPNILKTAFAVYSVGETVGQGGNGIVFKVTDESGEAFAAKILNVEQAKGEKLKRFRNELNFCLKTRHPNILSALDHGVTENNAPFFVMPVFAFSLRAVLNKLTPDEAVQIFKKIIAGTETAHSFGVIHRDIKPENILLSENFETVVLADFGIAHFAEADLYTAVETKDDARMANFQYAAPEQRERGQNIGPSADIYALGLILNELFTKKLAHGTNFARIADCAPSFAFLDILVEQMLEQNPSSRPTSISKVQKEYFSSSLNEKTTTTPEDKEKSIIPVKINLEGFPKDLPIKIKGIISNPNGAILLDDLVGRCVQETTVIHRAIETELKKHQPSKETIPIALSLYEEATYPLFDIACLLSRWGQQQHEFALKKILARLTDDLPNSGGLKAWLSLKWFPLNLLLYGAGIAAISGENWRMFSTILSTKVENEEVKHVCKPVYVGVIEEMLELRRLDVFKILPGHEQHYVPQSEYTFSKIQNRLNNLLFLGNSFEKNFDTFEVLLALIYADISFSEGSDAWGPLGRFGWKYKSRRRDTDPFTELVKIANSEGTSWGPIQIGFFNSSTKRFSALSEAFDRFLKGLNWY